MEKALKGFTLIELLVVIAIIGILATVVILNVAGARTKAAYAKVKSETNEIYKAAEVCKLEGGTLTHINISFTDYPTGAAGQTVCTAGTETLSVSSLYPSAPPTGWEYTTSSDGYLNANEDHPGGKSIQCNPGFSCVEY